MSNRLKYIFSSLVILGSYANAQQPLKSHHSFDLKGEHLGMTIREWAQANPRLWNVRATSCQVGKPLTFDYQATVQCLFVDHELGIDKATILGKRVNGYIITFDRNRSVSVSYQFPMDESFGDIVLEVEKKFGKENGCDDVTNTCSWGDGIESVAIQEDLKEKTFSITLMNVAFLKGMKNLDL